MAHGDHGGHAHQALSETSARLRLAFAITAAILVTEVAGGLLSNSLALLSDAGHVFTDVLALGLAWFASAQAMRPPTPRRTFGYHRVGILTALANAVSLLAVSLFITWEAVQRLQSPEPVDTGIMLLAALVGMAANLYVALSLHREPGENLNVRSAMLHVLGDVLASAAVIVGGVIILYTGWYFVDPLLSVLIALIIVGGAWSIVLEAINILLEGTPTGISLDKVLHDIRITPGVMDAHDLHVWSLAPGIHAMSVHVVIEDRAISEAATILETISQILSQKYGVNHTTVQLEHEKCGLACALFECGVECG